MIFYYSSTFKYLSLIFPFVARTDEQLSILNNNHTHTQLSNKTKRKKILFYLSNYDCNDDEHLVGIKQVYFGSFDCLVEFVFFFLVVVVVVFHYISSSSSSLNIFHLDIVCRQYYLMVCDGENSVGVDGGDDSGGGGGGWIFLSNNHDY